MFTCKFCGGPRYEAQLMCKACEEKENAEYRDRIGSNWNRLVESAQRVLGKDMVDEIDQQIMQGDAPSVEPVPAGHFICPKCVGAYRNEFNRYGLCEECYQLSIGNEVVRVEPPPGRLLTEDEDGTLLTADGHPVICPLVSIGVVARSPADNPELPLAYCNTRCAWCDSGYSPHGEVTCGVNTTIGYLRRTK